MQFARKGRSPVIRCFHSRGARQSSPDAGEVAVGSVGHVGAAIIGPLSETLLFFEGQEADGPHRYHDHTREGSDVGRRQTRWSNLRRCQRAGAMSAIRARPRVAGSGIRPREKASK
jgi:hypothetical protein